MLSSFFFATGLVFIKVARRIRLEPRKWARDGAGRWMSHRVSPKLVSDRIRFFFSRFEWIYIHFFRGFFPRPALFPFRCNGRVAIGRRFIESNRSGSPISRIFSPGAKTSSQFYANSCDDLRRDDVVFGLSSFFFFLRQTRLIQSASYCDVALSSTRRRRFIHRPIERSVGA